MTNAYVPIFAMYLSCLFILINRRCCNHCNSTNWWLINLHSSGDTFSFHRAYRLCTDFFCPPVYSVNSWREDKFALWRPTSLDAIVFCCPSGNNLWQMPQSQSVKCTQSTETSPRHVYSMILHYHRSPVVELHFQRHLSSFCRRQVLFLITFAVHSLSLSHSGRVLFSALQSLPIDRFVWSFYS